MVIFVFMNAIQNKILLSQRLSPPAIVYNAVKNIKEIKKVINFFYNLRLFFWVLNDNVVETTI